MSERRCETCRFSANPVIMHVHDPEKQDYNAVHCMHGPSPPLDPSGYPGTWPRRFLSDWCHRWQVREEVQDG